MLSLYTKLKQRNFDDSFSLSRNIFFSEQTFNLIQIVKKGMSLCEFAVLTCLLCSIALHAVAKCFHRITLS